MCFSCNSWANQNTNDLEGNLFQINEGQFESFLQEYFTPLRTVKKSFENLSDARAYWESEDQGKVLFPDKIPNWVKYDGMFSIEVKIKAPIPERFESNKERIQFFNSQLYKDLNEMGIKDGFSASYYGPTGEDRTYCFDFESTKEFWNNLAELKKGEWKEYSRYKLDLMFKP